MAQLALNTLKTPVVVPDDNTLHITTTVGGADTTVTSGKVTYKVTASRDAYAYAISAVEGSDQTTINGIQGAVVELGEKLYNGKLQLNENGRVNDVAVYDDFGRPARRWQYDGTTFGTYPKVEELRQEYTKKVTGKDLYDLLGADIVNSIKNNNNGQWTLNVTIDGETTYSVLNPTGAYFSIASIVRTNTDAVGNTGNGVLTQVYVDSVNHEVNVAIINTYLAIAEQDYNSRDDDVDLKVYHISDDATGNNKQFVKTKPTTSPAEEAEEIIAARGEDFAITEVKEDDKFLVTIAQGEIKSMVAPEIVSETTLNSFKLGDWVKNDDAQYDYASTAQYDIEVLDEYDRSNMKSVTYNVVLDKYGYLVGIELNEELNQYLFLTGMDLGNSNLSAKNADANVIFLDGTMKTVNVDVAKSQLAKAPTGQSYTITGGQDDISSLNGRTSYAAGSGSASTAGRDAGASRSQINTWCTYTVNDDGVYTLKQVGNRSNARADGVKGAKKIAQSSMDVLNLDMKTEKTAQVDINSKNVSLEGSKAKNNANNANGDFNFVYGNDETVYINAKLKKISARGSDGDRVIVDKVDSVTTGIRNTDITVKNLYDNMDADIDGGAYPKDEIYVLYKDSGYIIGVVALGAEDNGSSAKYAYITKEVNQEDDIGGSSYRWHADAIIDGKKVNLTETDDSLNILSKLEVGKWYSLRFDKDGNVSGIKKETGSPNEIVFPAGTDALGAATGTTTDKYVESVPGVRAAINGISNLDGAYTSTEKQSSVLMYVDFTCNDSAGSGSHHTGTDHAKEIKYENHTLYTDRYDVNQYDSSFAVSPTVKVALITSKSHSNGYYDAITEYEDLDEAIKALGTETSQGWSKFDGYLSATFNNNGEATSIVIHDQSGNGKNKPQENAPTMRLTVTVNYDDGTPSSTTTVYWTGAGQVVATPSGYNYVSQTTPAFVENGSGVASINFSKIPVAGPMQVMVQYHTTSTSGPVVATEVLTVSTDVGTDKVLKVSTAAGADVDKVLTAPEGYGFDGAAQTVTKFWTDNGRETIDIVVITVKKLSGTMTADDLTAANAADKIEVPAGATVTAPSGAIFTKPITGGGTIVANGTTTFKGTVSGDTTIDLGSNNNAVLTQNGDLPTIDGEGTVKITGNMETADLDELIEKLGNNVTAVVSDGTDKTGTITKNDVALTSDSDGRLEAFGTTISSQGTGGQNKAMYKVSLTGLTAGDVITGKKTTDGTSYSVNFAGALNTGVTVDATGAQDFVLMLSADVQGIQFTVTKADNSSYTITLTITP